MNLCWIAIPPMLLPSSELIGTQVARQAIRSTGLMGGLAAQYHTLFCAIHD